MSFLDAFIGGAAQTGMGLIDQRMRDDVEVNKMRERGNIEQQLAIARQEALREINAKMGQQVSDMADTTNRQRIADRINSANGSEMSAEDAAAIAKNPEAMKAYGLSERSRAQEMDDLATAAGKYGAIDQAKMYRDQQNVEVKRDSEERNLKLGEERNRLTQAQIERQSQRDQDWKEIEGRKADIRDKQVMGVLAKVNGGEGGSKQTQLERNVSMLREMKYSDQDIKNFIFDKKGNSISDFAERLMLNDKFGEMTQEKAVKIATGLQAELQKAAAKDSPPPPSDKERQPGQSGKPITKAPPSIASIKGAPPGSSIGSMVSGQGWEVKDSSGKVIGYAKD